MLLKDRMEPKGWRMRAKFHLMLELILMGLKLDKRILGLEECCSRWQCFGCFAIGRGRTLRLRCSVLIERGSFFRSDFFDNNLTRRTLWLENSISDSKL